MRVLIVDDEPPARERLRALLSELSDIEVVGEAGNGADGVALAGSLAPDIALLDVRMPGMNGLEAARHLASLDESPAVIFTTAYDQYALEAFDAQAVAYLLKPIRKEKLAAAIAQAGRLTRPQLRRVAVAARLPERRTHIAARRRDGIKLIPVGEILFFFAELKYTSVHHAGGEDLIEDSLRALEEELGDLFVRIHRNTLVATTHLERIERAPDGQYFVHLRGAPQRLPVSRRMAGDLKERLRL
ncbi:MAG TPA: LytTR family DNA-binding domain-containing protein [Steroidobacteraceae bacterium]